MICMTSTNSHFMMGQLLVACDGQRSRSSSCVLRVGTRPVGLRSWPRLPRITRGSIKRRPSGATASKNIGRRSIGIRSSLKASTQVYFKRADFQDSAQHSKHLHAQRSMAA